MREPAHSDGQVIIGTTQARQGVTGHNVRYVLLAGTIGVVVLFTIVYVIAFT